MARKLELERFLPYRLVRVGAEVSAQFRAVYGPAHDLTIPEWRVLATLGQFGTLGAKAIGRHSAMHKTKVSRAVKALEERRWLSRAASAEDRREEALSLTSAGRRAYEDIVPLALAFEVRLVAALGERGAELALLLDALEDALGLGDSGPVSSPAGRRGGLPRG